MHFKVKHNRGVYSESCDTVSVQLRWGVFVKKSMIVKASQKDIEWAMNNILLDCHAEKIKREKLRNLKGRYPMNYLSSGKLKIKD